LFDETSAFLNIEVSHKNEIMNSFKNNTKKLCRSRSRSRDVQSRESPYIMCLSKELFTQVCYNHFVLLIILLTCYSWFLLLLHIWLKIFIIIFFDGYLILGSVHKLRIVISFGICGGNWMDLNGKFKDFTRQ
jgi:hypothetical protein